MFQIRPLKYFLTEYKNYDFRNAFSSIMFYKS